MREETGTERQEETLAESGDGPQADEAMELEPGDGGDAEITAELDELRQEIEHLNDRHLRLAAEFDNYRKRIERDRQTLVARLQVDLVSSLLDVVDDLERVAESDPGASAEALIDGVRLVEKKFMSILGAAGLEAVEAEGAPFDPSVMDAMAAVATDDPSLDDHVADVFQRGYRFGEVLVRPARVRVYKYDPSAGGSE